MFAGVSTKQIGFASFFHLFPRLLPSRLRYITSRQCSQCGAVLAMNLPQLRLPRNTPPSTDMKYPTFIVMTAIMLSNVLICGSCDNIGVAKKERTEKQEEILTADTTPQQGPHRGSQSKPPHRLSSVSFPVLLYLQSLAVPWLALVPRIS